MGTVIKLHIHARTAVSRGIRAASTSSVIPFTRRNGVDMPVTPKTIGRRLLRTRQALKLSQAEFCRQIGVERNLYNPFEKGRRRITIDVAMKIRDRYGVTLDWIYAGDPHDLPSELYHQLVASIT
jgi:DNA-binding XRE family transcriptional regulator